MFSQVSVCPQSAAWIVVHCSALLRRGRYASYWNAFLFVTELKPWLYCITGEEGPEDRAVERFRLRAVRGVRVTDEVFVAASHDRRTLVRRAHSKLKGERPETRRLIPEGRGVC